MAKSKKTPAKRTPTQRAQLAHLYRHFRQHQQNIQAEGGGMLTTFPSGRTELSYASSAYGCHALGAWQSARSHAHFLASHRR